jgi:hypothetical protein
MRQRTIKCISLSFANSDTVTANVFVPFPVSSIKLKHLSFDVSANAGMAAITEISSNLVSTYGSQAIIGIPIPANGIFTSQCDIEYGCASVINGQYIFNLKGMGGVPITGTSISVMLTMEFLGNNQ